MKTDLQRVDGEKSRDTRLSSLIKNLLWLMSSTFGEIIRGVDSIRHVLVCLLVQVNKGQ